MDILALRKAALEAGFSHYQTMAGPQDNLYLKVLPAGFALVAAGTFCGKPATARVLLPAENLVKFLPAAPSTVDA